MTTRETPFPAGTPCWVDLVTSDLERSQAFYGELLGWTFTEPRADFGGYVNALSDGHQVAGLMTKQPGNPMPDLWSTYISSDDISATLDAFRSAGGQVMFGPDEVGTLGSMAVALDPTGAGIGIWQPGEHTGFRKHGEPGSVAWNELHSKDFAASTAFYEAVFGWDWTIVGDTDEFRYRTALIGGQEVGGVMDSAAFLPPAVPSHWAVYFCVADADAASARASELGATVNRGPEDTPYGRMTDLVDPTGAGFKLIQLPE